ncbi:MAG: acyl-CoA desaturase [Planctomycetaceae bacterium]|nr:acyl-CoA desaturase [Planctomycetaceae bacterium]
METLSNIGLRETTLTSSAADTPHQVRHAAAEGLLDHEPFLQLTWGVLAINFISVFIPFVGLIGAMISLWGYGIGATELVVMGVMYLVSGLGITVGYHRLFTHRAFEATPALQAVLAISGATAVQGPLLQWVAVHRRHHRYSDHHGDPHSPKTLGSNVGAIMRGFWHAHLGWLFVRNVPDLAGYVKDLRRNPLLMQIDRLFVVWVALGLLIPAALGGWLTGTYAGAIRGFLWGGLVRVLLVSHVTWSINSVCHLWGSRPYPTRDLSRNNVLFGWLGLGEGWHNNHHAYPTSARHGLKWWQFDVSYLLIRACEKLGWAWNVHGPEIVVDSGQPHPAD